MIQQTLVTQKIRKDRLRSYKLLTFLENKYQPRGMLLITNECS